MAFHSSPMLWTHSGLAQMVNNLPANAGDPGPGDPGNGNPPQYSCLENSMDRGAWQATIHGVMKSQTWLSNCHFLFRYIYDQTHGWRWRKRLCSSSVPSPSFSPLLLPSTYVSLFSSGLTAFPMNLLCSIEDLACRFTFSLQIVLTTSPGFGRDQ